MPRTVAFLPHGSAPPFPDPLRVRDPLGAPGRVLSGRPGRGRDLRLRDHRLRPGRPDRGGADVFAQTRQALANLRQAVEALGGEVSDGVRTRVYVRELRSWEGVARAHHELFGEARPATTMVEVSGFIDEALRVEGKADARVPPERAQPSGRGSSPA